MEEKTHSNIREFSHNQKHLRYRLVRTVSHFLLLEALAGVRTPATSLRGGTEISALGCIHKEGWSAPGP